MVERTVELGDRFKYRDGTIGKVVAMGKEKVIIEIIKPGEHASGYKVGGEMPDSIKNLGGNAFIEKIEPWFEVGKTYRKKRYPEDGFTVKAIIENAKGKKYAVGLDDEGCFDWDLDFDLWQEV